MTASRRPVETPLTRHVVAAALTLLIVGTLGAVQAAMAGGSFMHDLEQVQPALARIDPVIGDPHTPRLARRVFLVIVDGLRLDKSYQLPFLDELRRRGVDGEATALLLKRELGPLGVAMTRIASGVPHGGDLEYADPITMGRALAGRQTL